jgi:hypothetical protein
MLYKVTSGYAAKFLAGHYCIGQPLLPNASPSLRVVASIKMVAQPRHYVPMGYSTVLGRAAPDVWPMWRKTRVLGGGLKRQPRGKPLKCISHSLPSNPNERRPLLLSPWTPVPFSRVQFSTSKFATICRWQPNFPFHNTVKNCAIVLWISCSSFCREVLSVERRMCLFEVRSSQVQTTFLRNQDDCSILGPKKLVQKLILGLLAWVWPGEVIDSHWIICG